MEIELKFQVPRERRQAVLSAVATASAVRTRLRAVYADTADQRLARAGLALRLRQEGRRWVQTLKGRGDGLAERLEHEVLLAVPAALPDPVLHAGTPLGACLIQLLDGQPLQARFVTDIHRTHRVLRLPGGAQVELAFDEGHIAAGGRRQAVCEMEFELIRGPFTALLDLAGRWVQRHSLWLDVRTKSEIGHRLAEGLQLVPATLATRPRLKRRSPPGVAFAAALVACLQHVLPNQAELAQGELPGAAREPHLHQWRVAVRRLRTALGVMAAWSTDPEAAAELNQRWREAFATTSAARDADVVAALLAQPLAQAGLAPLPRPAGEDPTQVPASVFRAPALTTLVLHTLRLAVVRSAALAAESSTESSAEVTAVAARPGTSRNSDLRAAARRLCKRSAKRLWPQLESFDTLAIEERHRLRRRLKRLRYTAELLGSVWPKRDLERCLRRLRAAVEALGHCNDLAVARTLLAGEPDTPASWFARGWVSGRQDSIDAAARYELQRLARLRAVWR